MENNQPVRMRLILDIDYVPNGASIEEIKAQLQGLPDKALRVGLLTSEATAKVVKFTASAVELPKLLKEADLVKLQSFMQDQIANGHLTLDDVTGRLVRYGVAESHDFISEMLERMEQMEFMFDHPDALPGEPTATLPVQKVEPAAEIVSTLHADDVKIPMFLLNHSGRNQKGYTVDAAYSGDPGIYDELRVGVYSGKDCVADVLVGLTEAGEPRVLCTVAGDGSNGKQIAIYPLRAVDDAVSLEAV